MKLTGSLSLKVNSPRISIIIPARDEEQLIPACLESIKIASSRITDLVEVIVVLNRCQDRTEEIAKSFGCLIVNCDEKNLSAIRNAGARFAQGEILITIDADSRMSPNMLEKVCANLSTGRVIGGGVWIYPERNSLGIFVTGLLLLPTIIKNRILCGLFFCFKKDFEAISGFNPELTSAEDIDFAIRLKRLGREQGKKFKTLLSAHIITSCRKFDHFGDWYFVKRPRLVWDLLKGKDQKAADRVWYDFPRG